MTIEDLIKRAAILLSFEGERETAEILASTGELSPEEIFLAVKAAVILIKEETSE